jgi:hypothetical protein
MTTFVPSSGRKVSHAAVVAGGIAIENAGKFEKRRQELEVDFAKAIIYTSE